MKTFRFIHTADWHSDADPKKQAKLEASLNQMLDFVKKNKVDAIIHAGDTWEKRQSYDGKSGVPLVVRKLRELSEHVDFIFFTKGNNAHDEPGSISLLHQLEPNIYAYESPVILSVNKHPDEDGLTVTNLLSRENIEWEEKIGYKAANDFTVQYIVSLVPYPTKASFISEDSIDNNNADFLEKFEQVFELIGDKTAEYSCPKILGFHGNVVGSRLSTGQTLVSQDIMVAPSTLEKANHDYYGLGHIHLRQFFKPNMGYSGSIYNKNWGEIEQKSFEIIEFNDSPVVGRSYDIKAEAVPLTAARPMVKIDAEYDKGTFWTEAGDLFNYVVNDEEFRIRIKINENDRKLITEDSIQYIKNCFGQDVKIEFNIIPAERESRSEQIMHCKSLLDEVKEYASVTEQPVNGTIESKVAQLQGEGVEV